MNLFISRNFVRIYFPLSFTKNILKNPFFFVKLELVFDFTNANLLFLGTLDTNKNNTAFHGHHQHGLHHSSSAAAMAAAAAAVTSPTNTFLGQYPALFDPTRTSHLDWHLHAASFHNAQGMNFNSTFYIIRQNRHFL